MTKIKEIRETSGLSRAEFSRQYRIPLRTLENWEAGTRSCPEYLTKLLARVVDEDAGSETLSCYDNDVLRELGACYGGLLYVLNNAGKDPFPNSEIFPAKYFTLIHLRAVRLGIPSSLSERIGMLMDRLDPDDFAKSMNIPTSPENRMAFMMGMNEANL